MRILVAIAAFSLVSCATCVAQDPSTIRGASLDGVLKEVQGGLQRAQDVLEASSLPKLQTVQLTLHTQAVKDATGKIKILFVTFGGGKGASSSQELALTLEPPKPRTGFRPEFAPTPSAADSIVELIKEAAKAVKIAESGTPPLEAKALTLDLVFTVTETLGGGIQFNVGGVGADVSGDLKSSSEQKIKITFGR